MWYVPGTMRFSTLLRLGSLLGALALAPACSAPKPPPVGLPEEGPVPDKLPPPPLALPNTPPAGWDTYKTQVVDDDELPEIAHRHAMQGKWNDAALTLYQFLQKPEREHERYNLACYLSRAGNVDGALYWLQEAVKAEGVDPQFVVQDPDLMAVHADPRWPVLQEHINAAARYWQAHGPAETRIWTPPGYQPGTPIDTVVLMHGIASEPQNTFIVMMPPLIDSQVAVVSVSGTWPRGPHAFLWAEDPEKDHARVTAALASSPDKLTAGKVALVGFSQGGLVALNLVAAYPDAYTGAVAFSPGGNSGGTFGGKPSLAGHHAIIVVGAGESAEYLRLSENAAEALAGRGAEVLHRVTPNQVDHGLPMDFRGKFPGWVSLALGRP